MQKTLSYKVPYRLAMIGHQGCGHERKRDDGKAGDANHPARSVRKEGRFCCEKSLTLQALNPAQKIDRMWR
jgi:hypothetical protein